MWSNECRGTEMKRLMMDHAFQFVRNVVFLIGLDNIRSQKAVERIGGMRNGSRINERGEESAVYVITRP